MHVSSLVAKSIDEAGGLFANAFMYESDLVY